MNIRKFTGATSRDALRLVREALGADAVVLSNRSLADGSVEIVALADSELASIAPAAGKRAAAALGGAAGEGAARAGAVSGFANPYASGLPDVFSSVFGASPEAGADGEPGASAPEAKTVAALIGPEIEPARPRVEKSEATAPAKPAVPAASIMKPVERHPAPAPRPTMAETNPWLIDHAQQIAAKRDSQPGDYSSKQPPLTPAAAAAKGLGAPGAAPAPMSAPVPASGARRDDPHGVSLAAIPTLTNEAPDWAREAAQLAARRATQRATTASGYPENVTAAVTDAINARMSQIVNETVMNELASLRGMMEEHFAGLLWADSQRRSPIQSALTRHLFAAGFSAQLVRMVVDNLPAVESFDAGMEWVHSVLESNLPVMESEDALMERGGVFALMGPTGVGKTTTTAKLAARCVMRYGASKVALLTTDSYRIGGHEQLRIFGKILGVSVHAVKDGADLQLALSELRNKHIVLIDTIGMSQRDRLVSDQIAMLSRAGQPVQRLLLLNATCHGDTLNEVVQAYQSAPDKQPLAGCILTKLDEATNLGSTLDAVLRYRLPVHYVSTGQKVPENLYVATKKFLVRSAFCIPRDHSPFVPQEDDVPGLLSALSARSTAEQHEVRFG
ncbi:flagellar biosynthesis protein FlhF [Paraburkholderia sp. SOS3]|uniref:flagellar biosynthesis protein FlhF n=1 Tax=Paraburkholderia sp. SOS3 TaxID=1926494 RepID=UPI0009475BDB|nr:flagellar biosynthesis protein FlhF [Paraburkholderia sp. SOS3]APR34065.1 flagellar biosynthesis protein FlhF [Paraburkholderia sp. SOS3]APR37304.1 flagellar biosynthesis protein FlhF [Paraburkholderia sp. SOS3]